jgi:hypothetical protein
MYHGVVSSWEMAEQLWYVQCNNNNNIVATLVLHDVHKMVVMLVNVGVRMCGGGICE